MATKQDNRKRLTASIRQGLGAVRVTQLNQLMAGRSAVEGNWSLTPRHEILYTRSGDREEAVLRGRLAGAEPDALLFLVSQTQEGQRTETRTVRLQGRWEADPLNRLAFLVEREEGRYDRLTLEGMWEVNDAHRLIYRSVSRPDSGKRSTVTTLTFQGVWDIDASKRLVYLLDADGTSGFRFRGAFQTPSILAKEGRIRYQVGIELNGKRRFQTVTLFGKWKFSRDLALEFEMDYGKGRKRSIRFGAAYEVGHRGFITARLMSREGRPLGVEVVFGLDQVSAGGRLFGRWRKSGKETTVEAGARWPW
ncbi:MAG: hypothetical protein NC910_03965 [Candidatus Omnitrophica bacterium]|nr:hypothetical protein [Candidatus Omnitrophota bacterium]